MVRLQRNSQLDLVAGKIVKVWPTDTDRYGRTVAFVFVGGVDLNKELLKAGLAWHYKQYSRDPELAKLEFEARAKKVGLWVEPGAIAPWEWRKQKSLKQSLSSVVGFLQPLSIDHIEYHRISNGLKIVDVLEVSQV